MLIVLLIVSAVARRQASPSTRRKWLIAGIALFLVALVSGFGYPVVLGEYTYPERVDLRERKICASDIYLTSDARQYKQTNPSANAEDLEQNLPDGDIWSAQGIKKAEMTLLTTYVAFVLSIAGAIFCLLEASVSQGENSSVAVTQ